MEKNAVALVLNSLHTFVAVGRHMSFSKAAEELCLTPGAVSHRIRGLEETLGFPLFHRFTRRIGFTPQGEMLFSVLDRSLGEIAAQIRNIDNQKLNGELTVTCPPSFASVWLMDRLPDFRRRYPGINIHLYSRNDLVDFEHEPVDLAIYYGAGIHPGLHVTLLLEESMSPVCSPAYADSLGLWGDSRKLKDCVFLHDNTPVPNAPPYSEWQNWAYAAGIGDLPFHRCYSFDRWELAIKGAVMGMGIAMGRSVLIRDSLFQGELVQPFPLRVPSLTSYSVVNRQEDVATPRIAVFREWLLEQLEPGAKSDALRGPELNGLWDGVLSGLGGDTLPVERLTAEYCHTGGKPPTRS